MSHIALFIPELECGGAQRVFLLLSREFLARGHKVDLVLAQARGPLLDEIAPGVRLVDLGAKTRLPELASLGLSSIRRLKGYLRKESPEALLSTLTGGNLAAVAARVWSGANTRLVLREAVSQRNRDGRLWQCLMRWAYPKADAVVTLSQVMLREMIDLLSIPERKLFCIPNPVDAVTLQTLSKVSLSDARFDSGASPFILSAGRLTPQKDYETLIRAFSHLVGRQDIHLVILGEGSKRSELESLVAQLNLQDRVHMPGHDTNPWRWMKRACLFVLSSRWEGHPNVLLEAVAIGIPVISTEYDKSAHTIVGDRGRIVPVSNAKLMAAAIEGILENPPTGSAGQVSSVTEVASCYLQLLSPQPVERP